MMKPPAPIGFDVDQLESAQFNPRRKVALR